MSEDWDDEGGEQGELVREWELRREQHYNGGYREGLDQGKEKTIQQGFDSGFRQGCIAGYEWGLLQGAASTLGVFAEQMQSISISEASALADRMDLPKKQVMLVQCEALVEQSAADANKPETHAKPDEAHQLTSEAFAKPFTAAELKTRMVSAKSSLLQMGLNIKHRQDMQLRLDSHVEDHKHHSG